MSQADGLEAELASLKDALRAAEARFKSVVDGAVDGIVIQQDERIVFANPAMAALFGYAQPQDLIGLNPFDDLIAGEDLGPFRARTAEAFAGSRVVPHNGWRARHREGKEVWISSTGHSSEWQGRKAVTSFFVDITDRRLAELALRENEARYRAALIAGRMGAWETDLETRTRTWTKEGMDLFGLSIPDLRGQVGGAADEYWAAIHPDDRYRVTQIYEEANFSDSFLADYRIVRPDGAVVWLAGRGQVISRWPDGKARRLMSIMADDTERRDGELQVQVLLRELSHRSKNMLAVIQSVARRTAKSATSIDEFANDFGLRLEGLSASHELLLQHDWHEVPLERLVRQHFAPFLDPDCDRLAVVGPAVAIDARAAQSIGLALNELATNAIKHGALSVEAGRVTVSWEMVAHDQSLHLTWCETGGPPVAPADHQGFGSMLLRSIVANTIKGKAVLTFAPSGIVWSLVLPANHIVASGPEGPEAPPAS